VKGVKLVKPGLSEVTYVKKEVAHTAVKTYHERELDGRHNTVLAQMSGVPCFIQQYTVSNYCLSVSWWRGLQKDSCS